MNIVIIKIHTLTRSLIGPRLKESIKGKEAKVENVKRKCKQECILNGEIRVESASWRILGR